MNLTVYLNCTVRNYLLVGYTLLAGAGKGGEELQEKRLKLFSVTTWSALSVSTVILRWCVCCGSNLMINRAALLSTVQCDCRKTQG